MELYDATWNYVAALPTVQAWPELQQLLQRVIRNRPSHWWMAARACLAAGGSLTQAVPAVAAMGALFLNIVLIDDLLDDDPKGQHLTLGIGPTANIATALQAIGLEAITRTDLPLATQAVILRHLNTMIQQTALGQYLDTQNACDEASYWRVTRTKSSPYFATSFFVGAMMAGAPTTLAHQLAEIGGVYGEMVQINDDLSDVLAVPTDPDWLQGRYPLPILYATLVPHPEQARFIALRPQTGEAWALAEAQEILIRSGAISYGIDQLLQRGERVRGLLRQTALPQPQVIEEMMASILQPVSNLLAQMAERGPDAAPHDDIQRVL